MNRRPSKLLLCLSIIVLLTLTTLSTLAAQAPSLPAKPVPGEGAAGEWLGILDVGAARLRLGLHVEKKEDGSLGAVLDSIDQGAKIPVDAAVFERRALRLDLKALGASYDGTLNADGSVLEGTWSQSGQKLPLQFHRLEQTFALRRPQLPQGPVPYESREVMFRSEAGNIRLAGTLILPEGKGPFPAVALVSGSGPQDRDEAMMGHKPFLVLADALARRGIASLRWDDRGAAASEGDHFGSTLDDFAADARAAVAFLRSCPEINRNAVGIAGHSEGGLIAPMAVAAETSDKPAAAEKSDKSVAFLVLLAPPGEPLQPLLLRQARALLRLRGVDAALIDRALAAQSEDLALIADPAVTAGRLEEILRERAAVRRKQFTDEERARLRIDAAAIEQGIEAAKTPWFRSLVRQDPAVYLRQVKIPVLALFGDKDLQVDAQVNAEAVRAALAAAGNPAADVRILPGLNHLFQHARTGGIDEYATIEETFSPEALAMIGDWIKANPARAALSTPRR
ncbi:MAG TPA: alpha/beta hydrolase [Thermoanaerobaculia bacterium]|nr:alpha/beta hydrolase [Thermoanaerobaculia bacterium]